MNAKQTAGFALLMVVGFVTLLGSLWVAAAGIPALFGGVSGWFLGAFFGAAVVIFSDALREGVAR